MSFAMFLVVVVAIVIVALGIIGAFIERKTSHVQDNQLMHIMDNTDALAAYGIAQAQARMQAEKELERRISELKDQQAELRKLKKYV